MCHSSTGIASWASLPVNWTNHTQHSRNIMETYRRRWQGKLHLNQISFFYHFPKRKLCMKIEINTNSWRHCLRLLKWAIYCIVYLNRNFNRNEKLCYIIFTFESYRYLFKIHHLPCSPKVVTLRSWPGYDLGGDVIDEGGEIVCELVGEAGLAPCLVSAAPIQVLHHRLHHQLEQRPANVAHTIAHSRSENSNWIKPRLTTNQILGNFRFVINFGSWLVQG